MKDSQKKQARVALDEMLAWCINGPMAEDKMFEVDPTFYSSLANYYYYAVSFLDEIGYLNRARRFWTDRTFPKAAALCNKLRAKLQSSGLDDSAIKAAARKLSQSCPAD